MNLSENFLIICSQPCVMQSPQKNCDTFKGFCCLFHRYHPVTVVRLLHNRCGVQPNPSLYVSHPIPLTRTERIHLLIACPNILMCLFCSVWRSDWNDLRDKVKNNLVKITLLLNTIILRNVIFANYWIWKWYYFHISSKKSSPKITT